MGIKKFFERWFGKNKEYSPYLPEQEDKGNGKNENGAKMFCVDCKREFLFEPGEQQFFKMKGLTPPKRCQNCRTKRKQFKRR